MPILYTKARPRYKALPASWWSRQDLVDNLGDELTPNLPLINVVDDFPWTLTPTTSEARKEAPYIFLREFLQLETQLNQSAQPYGKSTTFASGVEDTGSLLPTPFRDFEALWQLLDPLNVDTDNLYKGLFDHKISTDFLYKLPFFTQEYFTTNNNWQGTDILDKLINVQSSIGGGITRTIVKSVLGDKGEDFGKFLQNLPSLYKQIEMFNIKAGNPAVGLMDPPHIWKGSNNRTYTFQFPLFNINSTTDSNSINTIVKNWEFCFLITYQNLINKRNYFTGIPPVFYEVLIPGIHYTKAAYISDLTIENLGNLRLMKLPINGTTECKVNVPDGYSIKITLTDLLQPSKNLLSATVNTSLRSSIQAGNVDDITTGGGI
jgi:hypothetical protein